VPDIRDSAADSFAILQTVLDEWKAGIDAHDPDRVAATFAEDAVFQGLRPYTVGRAGVAQYYAGQPAGMTVDYRIEQARRLAEQVVSGYGTARFTRPDGSVVELMLGVVVTHADDRWLIQQYQVSAPPA
jgi:uncharacterized protein (TIGR02246 family)